MRTLIDYDPLDNPESRPHWDLHTWPYSWIAHPDQCKTPFVAAYRRRFVIDKKRTIRVHVTADERYELYLDGKHIGRGSERGDLDNWFFETYDLRLAPGKHLLVARVWSLGPFAGLAQITVRHGFLLAPEGDCAQLLGTGASTWEACLIDGYDFEHFQPQARFGVPANVIIDGSGFHWGFESGKGSDWVNAVPVERASSRNRNQPRAGIHRLTPATLPPMLEKPVTTMTVRFAEYVDTDRTESIQVTEKNHDAALARQVAALLRRRPMTVPPRTRARAIIDLDNYYCAFPRLVTSGGGGATVRIGWAESLCVSPEKYLEKYHRDEIWGKCFFGAADTFKLDGGKHRSFDTPWWSAGRYVEIFVATGGERVTIESLTLTETRYPLEMESRFSSSNDRLQRVLPVMTRTLQMCAHETYMDCPFYEQLMYPGDSRPQALAAYAISRDDRLARKAIRLFGASLMPSGLTRSQYPCREFQVIPTFSLWWVAMIHDYALWRGDIVFVNEVMPGARRVIDTFLSWRNNDGLIEGDHRWCFVDWVDGWTWGVPHEMDKGGVDGVVNWLFVVVLRLAADVEAYLGETEMARRYRRVAIEMSGALVMRFFDKKRGLFADDRKRRHWCEHAQCLAVLSDTLPAEWEDDVITAMTKADDLAGTTIFFTHYLFEALYKRGRAQEFFRRLGLWESLPELGFRTAWEVKGHTRSDCHGWGAHPLYHHYASILGVRPGSMGFGTVTIRPMLGDLSFAEGKLVHPKGTIDIRFERAGRKLSGAVTLPSGVTGTFVHNGRVQKLSPGAQRIAG